MSRGNRAKRSVNKRPPAQVPKKFARPVVRQAGIFFRGRTVQLHAAFRSGHKAPIIFLSGLGCSQSDFWKIFKFRNFDGHPILTFNFPGQGGMPKHSSPVPRNFRFTMGELADLTKAIVGHHGLRDIVLVGHSMGAVVGRELIKRQPNLVRLFVDVEGPMDLAECQKCIQLAQAKRVDLPSHFKTLSEHEKSAGGGARYRYGFSWGLSSPKALQGYSRALVREFTAGRQEFLPSRNPALRTAKTVYFYGARSNPPQLRQLMAEGVPTMRVPGSGHFLIGENPLFFFTKLKELVNGLASNRS